MNKSDEAKVAVLENNIDHLLSNMKEIKDDVKAIKGQFLPIIDYTRDMADLKAGILKDYVLKEEYFKSRSEFKSLKDIMRWLLGVITALGIGLISYIFYK